MGKQRRKSLPKEIKDQPDWEFSERYESQIEAIGRSSHLTLVDSSVLVIGLGGLGSPVVDYLARAGVSKLGLADPDLINPSNLNRQTLYSNSDVGMYKALVASKRVNTINPDVDCFLYTESINSCNADILKTYSLILDCSDNSFTRYLINDYCVIHDLKLIQGGLELGAGRISAVYGNRNPCFRCLFPSKHSGLHSGGSIGPGCGIISSWMAYLAIQWLIGYKPVYFHVEVPYSLGRAIPISKFENTRCYICRFHDSFI